MSVHIKGKQCTDKKTCIIHGTSMHISEIGKKCSVYIKIGESWSNISTKHLLKIDLRVISYFGILKMKSFNVKKIYIRL